MNFTRTRLTVCALALIAGPTFSLIAPLIEGHGGYHGFTDGHPNAVIRMSKLPAKAHWCGPVGARNPVKYNCLVPFTQEGK